MQPNDKPIREVEIAATQNNVECSGDASSTPAITDKQSWHRSMVEVENTTDAGMDSKLPTIWQV